jgi:hypothetical protein
MKKRIRLILGLLPILSVFFYSCRQSQTQWRGKIERHNGVEIVKNPIHPIFGEDIFCLEEELSIGAKEGPNEYMFLRVIDIDADDDGNIYVLDHKESHIKVFDKKGQYLRTIGQRGQGPGELGSAYFFSLTAQRHLIVEDVRGRRLVFFTLEGEFIKNLTTARNFVFGSKIDSKKCFYGITPIENENSHYELRKFDPNLEVVHTVTAAPSVLTQQKTYRVYSPIIAFDLDNDDNIIFSYPEAYEINICDPTGNLVRKITREFKPVEISEEEKEEVSGRRLPPGYILDIPKFHSAFQEILVDDQSRMYVCTWEKNNGKYYYDIFTAEGKYLVKVLFDFAPSAIKKDKLYSVEADEEGYQKIKRYQIIWSY